MSWFLSDELPVIPADILERLEAGFDQGDCFDVSDSERERGSVLRLIAINQKLHWRIVQLQSDLVSANTSIETMRAQVQDLVSRLRRVGAEPSRTLPGDKQKSTL